MTAKSHAARQASDSPFGNRSMARKAFRTMLEARILEEKLAAAKKTGNTALIKQITFALNARKWKH